MEMVDKAIQFAFQLELQSNAKITLFTRAEVSMYACVVVWERFDAATQLNPLVSTIDGPVGLRGRKQMGLLCSDTPLNVPFYISLSDLTFSGTVFVKYDLSPVLHDDDVKQSEPVTTKSNCSVWLSPGALKSVKVSSSFDGSRAGLSLSASVKRSLISACEKLAKSPLVFAVGPAANADAKSKS